MAFQEMTFGKEATTHKPPQLGTNEEDVFEKRDGFVDMVVYHDDAEDRRSTSQLQQERVSVALTKIVNVDVLNGHADVRSAPREWL